MGPVSLATLLAENMHAIYIYIYIYTFMYIMAMTRSLGQREREIWFWWVPRLKKNVQAIKII